MGTGHLNRCCPGAQAEGLHTPNSRETRANRSALRRTEAG